jgi:hypothetical protein
MREKEMNDISSMIGISQRTRFTIYLPTDNLSFPDEIEKPRHAIARRSRFLRQTKYPHCRRTVGNAAQPNPAGLLTCALADLSADSAAFSVSQWLKAVCPLSCRVQALHSGGTVHDFHMVPYSPSHDRRAPDCFLLLKKIIKWWFSKVNPPDRCVCYFRNNR